MSAKTTIYFNDLIIAYTDKPVTYERESDSQKEYKFTNIKNDLTATLFCDGIEIVQNENILVEIL